MSVSRVVYFVRAKAPSPSAWAEAIVRAGFPLELETDFDLDEEDGGLAGTFDGVEGGFEYYVEDAEDRELDATHAERIGERDTSIAFVTHSSMRDLAVAVAAAAVFCELADGVLHDEESDRWISRRDAVRDAAALIEEIRADL